MAGRTQPKCPNTPPRSTAHSEQAFFSLPPLIFSPSKLTNYLKHAEQNLGVRNAPVYETNLSINGYGPDILHLVETQALTDLGIPAGDAVRLKNGAQAWWSGPEARTLKRKASSIPAPDSPPDPKKYRFEKRWEDGGAVSYFGSAIELAEMEPEPCDYSWWYYCPLTKRMQQLPDRHVPVLAPEVSYDDDDRTY